MYYIVLRTDAGLLRQVMQADLEKKKQQAETVAKLARSSTNEKLQVADEEDGTSSGTPRGKKKKKKGESGTDTATSNKSRSAQRYADIDEDVEDWMDDREMTADERQRAKSLKEWERLEYDLEDEKASVRAPTVLTRENRSKPNFTYKLKIIIGFLQIATNLAFFVDIPWPQGYVEFIKNFNVVNLDFVPWQSVGCVQALNFYTKFLVVTLTPIGLLGVLTAFFLLPMYYIDQRDFDDDDRRRAARKRTLRKFWKLCLFTVFLMYPGVSSVVLNLFVCKDIYGQLYLVTDFTLKCADTDWYNYLGPVIIMTFLYPIGVPAFFFYMLNKNKDKLNQPGIRMQLGFLYEAYNLDVWWFELVDMLHKLTMTSLLAFLPVEGQMPTGMCVAIAYILVILLRRPYLRKGDDRLHLFAQTEIYLVVLAGYILYELNIVTLDTATDVLLSIVMIGMTVAMLVIGVLMAGLNLRKMYKAFMRRRRNAKAGKEAAADRPSGAARDNERFEMGLNLHSKSKQQLVDEKVKEAEGFKDQWVSPL